MLAAVIGLWVARRHTFDWATLVDADFSTRACRAGCSSASSSRSPSRRRSSRSTPGCPTPVARRRPAAAALLVGVLDKVGTFGILRYCLPLFPDASRYFAPLALALALVGIIYAALLAVGQNDLKRLVAYTSVAHFGFIGIGIFAFTTQAGPARCSTWSTTASPPALLFLVVGMLDRARRRLGMVADFGGARQAGAGAGRGVLLRRARLAGAARHCAVRQRVPGADRHVHGEQDGRDRRHRRASSWPPRTCCGWCSAPLQGTPNPELASPRACARTSRCARCSWSRR